MLDVPPEMPRSQPLPRSPLCQLKPVCVSRSLLCLLTVLLLNALVNVFNRFMAELCLGGDLTKRPVNCATLLFVVLLCLVSCQPRCFQTLSVALIQAELLLQCVSFLWTTQICSMQLGDLMPVLGNSLLGSVRVFKLLAIVGLGVALVCVVLFYVEYDRACSTPPRSDHDAYDDEDTCPDDNYSQDARGYPNMRGYRDEGYYDDGDRGFVSRSSQTCQPAPPVPCQPAQHPGPFPVNGRSPYTHAVQRKRLPNP